MKLTIGITTYFKSNPEEVRRTLWTLFDKRMIEGIIPEDVLKLYAENNHQPITVKEPVEIIVFIDRNSDVDDEITSKITEYVNSLSYKNCTFIVCKSTSNVKVSVARNFIITAAKGDYICFRDDDDASVNINELLSYIDLAPKDTTVIEYGYAVDGLKYRPSKLGPWSLFVKTEFLRKNNLCFVPDLTTEDIIWRGNLNMILSREPCWKSNLYFIQKPGYISLGRSNRSTAVLMGLDRYPKSIPMYIEDIMKDNTSSYKNISKVLYNDRNAKFDFSEFQFYGMSAAYAVRHGDGLIKHYLNRHFDMCDGFVKKCLGLINHINGTCDFWSIDDVDVQKITMVLFVKYLTFSDLYHFALVLDQKNPINKLNELWRKPDPLSAVPQGLKYNRLNEFTYKYMCLRWMRGEKIYCKVNEKLLNNLKQLLHNKLNHVEIGDVITFVHNIIDNIDKTKYKIDNSLDNHDILKYMCNKKAEGNIRNSLIQYFGKNYDRYKKYFDIYIRENNIKTTTLGFYDDQYKGFMNVFLSLLLAVPPRKNSIDVSVEKENREDEIINFLYGEKTVRMPRKGLEFTNRVPLKISGGCFNNGCYMDVCNGNVINLCLKIILMIMLFVMIILIVSVCINIICNVSCNSVSCNSVLCNSVSCSGV